MSFSFPSQKKLAMLRKNGVVPAAPWIGRLLVLFGLGAYFYFSAEKLLAQLLAYYQGLFASVVQPETYQVLFFTLIKDFIIVPVLLCLVLIFLGVLIQTRFYFSFDNLRLDFTRFGLTAQLQTIQPIKKILFFLALPILLAIGFILSLRWADVFMASVSWVATERRTAYLELFKSIASQIAVVALLLMILAVLLNWFYFRLEHSQNDHDSLDADSASHNSIDSIR